jgi:hypothetical protein
MIPEQDRKPPRSIHHYFYTGRKVMVTTEKIRTAKRAYLVQCQVRNLFSRTTVIEKDYLDKLVGRGIGNRWLSTVMVHGFDATNRCHCGIELHIDWLRYTIEVAVWGEEVRINQTVFAQENVAPEVLNAIEVFTQIVKAEDLRTEWRVRCAEGVDVELVFRELGLVRAPAITWAGKVSSQAAKVTELPELTVRLLIAEIADLVPVAQQKSLESLFKRLREHLGETADPSLTSSQAAELGRLMRVFVGIPPETESSPSGTGQQPSPEKESLFERIKRVLEGR